MKFVDLFAGLGGFHLALSSLGHECVFASEIDSELREVYLKNFPSMKGKVFGDIRQYVDKIPSHDILCGGFPCQPFSKSGAQLGLHDKIRGTLFNEIITILENHLPKYVILENVGNFERHDGGRTWAIVKEKLTRLGYEVRGTEHVSSGGPGLISPHHLGYPHSRERFFIVAFRGKLSQTPFPVTDRQAETTLNSIVQKHQELSNLDYEETSPSKQQLECIHHWDEFIKALPKSVQIPSFPVWGDELKATYPYQKHAPFAVTAAELRVALGNTSSLHQLSKSELIELLPNYAKVQTRKFPSWKISYIKRNREWFAVNKKYLSKNWQEKLFLFPPSLRKLEWNCKDEERDIWQHVLQFRPSGLRVKKYSTSPSLVAMATTQIPFLGPERRFLTRIEGLRLQGFPDNFNLLSSRNKIFKALGNAVHVEVVKAIAKEFLKNK